MSDLLSILDKHLSIAVVVGAILSAIIAASSSLLVLILSKRAEHKRARCDLAFRTGLEAFKAAIDISKNRDAVIAPLEIWILSATKLADLVYSGRLSESEIKQKLADIGTFIGKASESV
jgi:hypothetical protein